MAQENGQERQAEPRLSPPLSKLWKKIRAGTHHGKLFEVTVTETEIGDAIAWYLEGRPEIPFREPQVSIDLNGVEARGLVHLGAQKLPVSGRANITLQDGQPEITVHRLEMGKARLPDAVLLQVQAGLNRQFRMRKSELPVTIKDIELGEGSLMLRGEVG